MSDRYSLDIIIAMAERTIKRLWILIILLTVLLFGSNAFWVWYESQYEDVSVEQEVQQEADNGRNIFVGGDLYGNAESEDNG